MGRKPSSKNRTTTSLKVNPELWKQIRAKAILQGVTLSDLMEELIKKELAKEGKK